MYMASLILLIIFGLGVAFFATQNTGSVHILLGSYILSSIPLYMVVVGSLLLGIFISWLVSFVNSFSTYFTLYGKAAELKKSQETIAKLQEQNHDLEMEIAHFKGEKNIPMEKEEEISHKPSILEHIQHRFGFSSG